MLGQRRDPLSAQDLYVKTQVHRLLGQPSMARQSLRAALLEQPDQIGWRYELAQFLYDQGHIQESRREVRTILDQQPAHPAARELAALIARQEAEGR